MAEIKNRVSEWIRIYLLGSLTTGTLNTTSITVRTGNVNLTDGSLTVAGSGARITLQTGGTAASFGRAVLSGGALTVSTTAVTANSNIFLTSQVDGGTPGWLRISARNAGQDFTITSSSGTDTSTVAWWILEPA